MPTRVAIVGGGPAGLTLARILQRHGLEAAVFEREDSPDARTQGGSLDLHPRSGQRALDLAGLTEGFRALARPEGEAVTIVDPSGTVLLRRTPRRPGGRPEIDRSALRALLLDSLTDGTVRWGVRIGDPEALLTEGFDLVVGADGARSAVRRVLNGVEPDRLHTVAELGIPDADRTHPELAALVGPGSLWGLGSNQNLNAKREGGGRIRVTCWPGDLGGATPGKRGLIARYSQWSPRLTALIEAADDEPVWRELHTTPVGMRWTRHPSITLVGDAAHLMPPVGEGANQAMLDAALLALAVVEHEADPSAAIAAYEDEMFRRTKPVALESRWIQSLFLSPTAARDTVDLFRLRPLGVVRALISRRRVARASRYHPTGSGLPSS
jgi:2-polyprenyl-6-methoxyphenol hydroxylase-like FAD-dependent oxidoreductase